MTINKAIILGRLGQDPQIKFTQSGDCVATLSVATSEKWKDKNSGSVQEKTEWHRVIFWKRQAELCQEYLEKGSQVYIEGKIQTRKWTDKDNIERYSTEIQGREIKFLNSPKSTSGDAETSSEKACQPQGDIPTY